MRNQGKLQLGTLIAEYGLAARAIAKEHVGKRTAGQVRRAALGAGRLVGTRGWAAVAGLALAMEWGGRKRSRAWLDGWLGRSAPVLLCSNHPFCCLPTATTGLLHSCGVHCLEGPVWPVSTGPVLAARSESHCRCCRHGFPPRGHPSVPRPAAAAQPASTAARARWPTPLPDCLPACLPAVWGSRPCPGWLASLPPCPSPRTGR